MDPDETPEVYFAEGSEINCALEIVVTLTTAAAESYQWSSGQISQSVLKLDEAGVYSVDIEGKCREFSSAPVTIDFFEVEAPEMANDSITIDEIGEVNFLGRR
jgi:hypothetical protein